MCRSKNVVVVDAIVFFPDVPFPKPRRHANSARKALSRRQVIFLVFFQFYLRAVVADSIVALSSDAEKSSHVIPLPLPSSMPSFYLRRGMRGSSDDSSNSSSDGSHEKQAPLSCSLANPWASGPCPWSPGSNSARGYQRES